MADTKFYTNEAALKKAEVIADSLVTSKLVLFKDTLTPTEATTLAEIMEHEVVATGYTAGGLAITPFTAGLLDPSGGADVTSPLKNIVYGPPADPPVTDSVGGYAIVDADGDCRIVGIYNPPRPMASVGDGWAFVEQIVEARNP